MRETALDLEMVREVRAHRPEAVRQAAVARRRRSLLDDGGRLLLIAADHPARGALGVRDAPAAMADRSSSSETPARSRPRSSSAAAARCGSRSPTAV